MEEPPPLALGSDLGPSSTAAFSVLEHHWLRAMQNGGGSDQLPVDAAWQCLLRALAPCSSGGGSSNDLLQGYSFVSISELQSQQRMPCCSHLTWTSDEFNEWARQGESVLPKQRVLQQTHLILFGYMTDKTLRGKEMLIDGSLYLRDNTGAMPCVVLHFKLEWLERPLLFPNWVYIPQRGQNTAGYVEILGEPVQMMSGPEKSVGIIPVFYPGIAAQLLRTRPQCKKMAVWNVAGELFRLSNILSIRRKTFFFLFLKCSSSAACVPVLVQNPPQLVWHHVLQLGSWYILTNLKTTYLKTSEFKVFLTCSSSDLLPYCTEQVKEQFLNTDYEGNAAVSVSTLTCVQPDHLLDFEEKEKTLVPVKMSKMVSYTGTITQVLNAKAGLFELDGKFTLCLAYQPLLNSGRGLRPGACIELRDVHLLQDSLATSLPILGACLRSNIVIKCFSRYSTLHQPVGSFGNLYIHLLLHYNLNLSLYLLLVRILETFEQRFYHFIKHHDAVVTAEKFIVPVLNSMVLSQQQERNIHQEILAETHHCPLQQVQMLEMPCQIPPFSLMHTMVEEKCWETFRPRQSMSSAAETSSMSTQELNRKLAWSYDTLSAESFQPPLVLLGVLECSKRGSLQLRDRTKELPCVIFHRDGRPFVDTSLIGCFLQIEIFQLVMEQFLQSHFPSWQQLESHKNVKEKRTRLYVLFCFEDMKVLHAPEKRVPVVLKSTTSGAKANEISVPEPRAPKGEVLDEERAILDTGKSDHFKNDTEKGSSVSRLFLVTHKEGLLQCNYQLHSEGKQAGQGALLCFQATVQWLSKPEWCGWLRDTGGQPELKKSCPEEAGEAQQKVRETTEGEVLLVFWRKSLRWFPFLHPGHVYELIFSECLDLDVFDKHRVLLAPGRDSNLLGCTFFLPVPDNASLRHVSQVSQLLSPVSEMKPKLFSITEILSPSCTKSLVSFFGEVVERSLCESLSSKKLVTDYSSKAKGNLLPGKYTVKLSLSPVVDSPALLDVYVEGVFLPDLWGMLPGARVLFQNLERKISRFKNVYCIYIASSCMCVLTPPSKNRSSHNLGSTSVLSGVYLFNLALQPPSLCQIQLNCHVKCVLSLSLDWICSLCSSSFKEGKCNQNNPSCLSRTGEIKANARILVEDGTSECVVLCRNQQVQQVLGLSPKEWNVLQNHVQRRGNVSVYTNGSAEPGETEEPKEVFTWYLRTLCRSPLVCRAILLTCQLDRKPSKMQEPGSGHLRRFISNDVEFLSQTRPQQFLICLKVQEAT